MESAIHFEDVIKSVVDFTRGDKYCADKCYHREYIPYGFSVNEETLEYYVFNRDYLVIPVKFTEKLLIKAMAASKITRKDKAMGHGRLHPYQTDLPGWSAYYFFDDGTAPKWFEETREYDKSSYE